VLEAGGNAFDAAVAVGFALAVTHPLAGNLGGGGFCVAARADGRLLALDFREVAPAAAHRDLYLGADGEVVPGLSTDTHLAVGVPGSVDGLLRLLEEHGTLPRGDVLAPAIALARDGFRVSPFLAAALDEHRERLAVFPATRRVFFADGEPLRAGDPLVQADLAITLEAIAAEGRAGFYEGRVAELLTAEMERAGGILRPEDLRAYRAKWREPFVFRDGEYELVTPPLPSSGGIVIAQILGLWDGEGAVAAGWGSAGYVSRLVEAERLAYADRNHWLGDADFVDVPVERLVSEEYLARRRALLPEEGAGRSTAVGPGDPSAAAEPEGGGAGARVVAEPAETTHYCVVDRDGAAVSVTTTLNAWFGMGAVVPGAGFLLNNEMDDFSAKPGVPNLYGLVGTDANSIEPGKRMLSSMTPAVVLRDGEPWLVLGTPGGSTIVTTVLQIHLNVTRFGMNVRQAVDAPRFHHQWLPDEIRVEAFGLSPDTRRILEAAGYVVREEGAIGRAAAIMRLPDGRLAGWADRRGRGKAAGH
jgi:gamma-glutamyltranspeptidase/glutathione hydrolase